jgi:predicted membrane protein
VIARTASLLLAFALTAGLWLVPFLRGHAPSAAEHGLLAPLLLTVCALFVHGVGYRPAHAVLDRLLSPWLLWPLVLLLALAWWRLG